MEQSLLTRHTVKRDCMSMGNSESVDILLLFMRIIRHWHFDEQIQKTRIKRTVQNGSESRAKLFLVDRKQWKWKWNGSATIPRLDRDRIGAVWIQLGTVTNESRGREQVHHRPVSLLVRQRFHQILHRPGPKSPITEQNPLAILNALNINKETIFWP